MSTLRTALGAVALVAAAGFVPATATVAGAAADPYPTPVGPHPADWLVIGDDTRTLAIAVPPSWNDIDTAPAQNDDGTPRAWISATPDADQFFPPEGAADPFSVPGVVYLAYPHDADTAGLLERTVYDGICTAHPVRAYDDTVFIGHIREFTDCAGTTTRLLQVAAHPADRSFTAMVLVQLTGMPDDEAILNGVLSSFGRTAPPAEVQSSAG